MEDSPPTTAERRELDRLGAFSDGVFAIAITLLVLNIEVPDVPGAELGSALRDLGGALTSYGIGFAVMGLFWYGHHKLFSRLNRSNGRLVLTNMVLLALIGLMPFTTGVLGGYDEPEAVALYAANVGVALLADGIMEWVAMDGDLLDAEPGATTRGAMLAHAAGRALIFFVSIPIAYLVSTSLAQWLWLLLALVAVADRRRHR